MRRAPTIVHLVLLILVSGGVLTGCAQIPRSGQVFEGGKVDSAPDSRGLEPLAAVPAPDASAAQIVAGLIEAMVSSAGEYGVAREYLSHDVASAWQPRAEAVVFRGDAKVELSSVAWDRATGTITVTQVATVSEDGRYRRLSPTRREVPVGLSRGAGHQWRVSSFDNLTLISERDFQFSYRDHPVMFLSQNNQTLVPVWRYFPNGPGLATRLAAAVLSGPPAELRPAYGSAAPEGTTLAPPSSITTDGDVAVLELTSQIKQADQAARVALKAQLLTTLRGALPVQDLQLRVDGGALDISSDLPPPSPLPGEQGRPVLLRDDGILTFDGSRAHPIPGLPQLAGNHVSDVAVAPGEQRYAVLAGNGTRLHSFTPGQPLGRALLRGVGLTQPSFDRDGWLWCSPAESDGNIRAISATLSTARVAAPWLADRQVRSLRVSPDGGLAAVVSDGSDGGRLDVVAIRRENGTPAELIRPNGVTTSLSGEDIRHAVWRSALELVVSRGSSVSILALDGPVQSTRQSPVVSGIAAGSQPGVGELVITPGGLLYQSNSGTWYRAADLNRIRGVAYPG